VLTQSQKQLYNASIKIVYRDEAKMLFRVYSDAIKIKYFPGQYGALGLYSDHPRIDKLKNSMIQEPILVKRAYSLSSSILDDNNQLINQNGVDYYEFYIDLVLEKDTPKPRLSPRLFVLNDDDRLFLGPKIVGHYTLPAETAQTNVLLIATTTGESPHNSIIAQLLRIDRDVHISHVVIGKKGWVSAYHKQHQTLMKMFSGYRYIPITVSSGYQGLEQCVAEWLKDQKKSQDEIGWALTPENSHIFLCGDPQMIGTPQKLGAWSYEYPDYGLMRIFEQYRFKAATRFQTGNISFESYW